MTNVRPDRWLKSTEPPAKEPGPRLGRTLFLKPMRLRPEVAADHAAIHALVRDAFNDEATAVLVRRIRESANYIPALSVVADDDGQIVGHIMLSHLVLNDGANEHRVVTLSPVSVRPDHQNQGVGAALIEAAIARADQQSEPLIVLEGSPAYYPRFGFQSAVRFGVVIHLPSWAPPEAAMVYPLARYRPEIRGTVIFPAAFDRVNQDRSPPPRRG
jgi:putative acetyltransferase